MDKVQLTSDDFEAIRLRRLAGEPWSAIAKDYGYSYRGIANKVAKNIGRAEIGPRLCPYCRKEYIPRRDDSAHCDELTCYDKHRQVHRERYCAKAKERRHDPNYKVTPRAKPLVGRAKTMVVNCIGHYCDGKEFVTPIAYTRDGRALPAYRLCQTCKERNREINLAFV